MTYTLHRAHRTLFMVIFLALSTNILHATSTLKFDKSPEDATLPFPMQTHALNTSGTVFLIGGAPTQKEEFSFVGVNLQEGNCFAGLQKETTILNNMVEMANPILGQSILHLAMLPTPDMMSRNIDNPIIVLEKRPETLFLVNSSAQGSMLCPGFLPDASGKLATTGILGIAAAGSKDFVYIFAAVKPGIDRTKQPHASMPAFGEQGSGIALIKMVKAPVPAKKTDEEEQKKTGNTPSVDEKAAEIYLLANMHAQPDNKITTKSAQPLATDNTNTDSEKTPLIPCAAALDKTSAIIKSGNDLAELNFGDMHWDPSIGLLFIALHAKTGSSNNDSACALVVGHVDENNSLVLRPFAPLTTLHGENSLAGTQGAHQEIAFHKVRTMFTSTWLHYVITVGGHGPAQETKRTVHALPILFSGENHGLLAARDNTTEELFGTRGSQHTFAHRRFKTAATQTHHAFTRTRSPQNMPAFVGGGEAPGDITDLIVVGDTVIVTCAGKLPEESGAFYSHALFDETGTIKTWSQWQRMGGSTEKMFAAAFFAPTGVFTYVTGPDAEHANIVKKTTWVGAPTKTETIEDQDKNEPTPKATDLASILNEEFSSEHGGVHGLFDFPPIGQSRSLLVVTGLQKISLVHNSSSQQTDFCMNKEKETNGEISPLNLRKMQQESAQMLVISGGALGDLGAITAAEMASYDDQRYLFAAGPGGVVVLSRNNIGGLTFKKIGNYSMVRKIIHDGPYVYVLTDKQVDRIDLHSLTYKGIENLHTVTCALVPAENYRVVSFTDLVVSGKFALLGTSRGLYRIGNNCDISNPTLTESNQLSWTEVAIPQGLTSVVKLCPVSTTGRAQDVAQGVGGIVYVVNGSVGKNQSRLHRFAVKGTDYIEIDDTTIQPIRDCYLGSNNKEGIPTYFINLGEYAHLCCLEGASLLFGRNQQGKDKAYLHALPYDSNIPVGIRSSTPRYHATSVPSMALNVDSATTITSVVRNSITGSILVGGNFGLRANE